jgi:pimeloyl-ACP methyl ester carboxylesterase
MVDALSARSASFAQVAGAFAARVLHPAHASDPKLLELLGDMARVVGTEGFVRQQTAAMNRSDGRDVLGELRCPALVLCGREDQTTPPALSEEIAQLLQGDVELVLVPESGHMSTLEQPAAVVKAFLRWIAKVDANA